MQRTTLRTALILAATLTVPTTARASHNHPAKATKFLVQFVRAHQQCLAGGPLPHNSPLAFGACAPVSASTVLSFGPKGSGQYKGTVRLNTLKQATDITLVARFTDVRTGDDGTGPGFDGALLLFSTLRLTDHYCNGAANDPCTPIDMPFPISLTCGSVASPPLKPGKCATKTTSNTVVAGSVFPGTQGNWELGQFQVYSSPSDLVFVQGIYLP